MTGSNGCNCNGALSYSWSGGATITAELTDLGNQFVQSISSAGGIVQFQNLCPRVYSLDITGLASGDTTLFFNIQDNNSSLPNFTNEVVCFSDAGQDEIIELADIAGVIGSNFQWTVPGNFQAINGDMNAYEMSSGVYIYTALSSSCLKSSGLDIQFYYNSAGSETGSLLICESEVDSISLITLLGGNPAAGGYWTFQGEEFNGIFYPATMDGGFSNRYYYNVFIPECGITDVAPATVIERVPPNPGFSLNTVNLFCPNQEATVNMFDLLGGNPERGGVWNLSAAGSNTMVTGIDSLFIPGQSPEGIYEYGLTPLLPCVGTYNTFVTISYYPDPSPGTNLDTNICITSDTLDILNAIGAPLDYLGTLSDLSGNAASPIYIPSEQATASLVYAINPFNCGVRIANIHIVSHPIVDAGPNQTIELCSSLLPIPTNSVLHPAADANGNWYLPNGVPFNGDIDINSPTQNLWYVKSNLGCGADTSEYSIGIDLPVNFTPSTSSISLCPNDNPVNLLSVLGSPNLYFTNIDGDTLPIVVYPDSSESGIIFAHLNSGNACPDLEFPISIELHPNAFMVDYYEHFICESEMPLPLNDLVPAEYANTGIWLNQNNDLVSLAQTPPNASETFTFELNNPPLCGSSNIEIMVHSETMVDGPVNSSTVLCQSQETFDLNSLLGDDFSGGWWLNNAPLNNTALPASSPVQEMFEYRISSLNSCPDAISYHQFEVRALPEANAGDDIGVCIGGDSISIGTQTQSGFTYNWNPSLYLQSGNEAQTSLVSPLTGGNQVLTYSLAVNDGYCTNTDTVLVTLHEIPSLLFADSIDACYGGNITIQPNTNGVLHWLNPAAGDSIAYSQTWIATENQTIRFYAVSDFGCSKLDSVDITVIIPPSFYLDVEQISSCAPLVINESIDSCNISQASFRWIIPGVDTLQGRDISTTISKTGIFDLVVEAISPEGCVSDTVLSSVYEVFGNPEADFVGYEESASNLRLEVRFTNVSSNAQQFEWSIDGAPIAQSVHLEHDFEGLAPGVYEICLLARSEEGCENSSCHNIDLIVEQVVFAPSAFTPNNDGTNDGFKPVINGFSPEVYEFVVADRWGNIIFKSTDPDEYWMGEVDNGEYYSQNGVYNWMLKAKKFDTVELEVYRGSVMMIR